jgi:hypothetical protein
MSEAASYLWESHKGGFPKRLNAMIANHIPHCGSEQARNLTSSQLGYSLNSFEKTLCFMCIPDAASQVED